MTGNPIHLSGYLAIDRKSGILGILSTYASKSWADVQESVTRRGASNVARESGLEEVFGVEYCLTSRVRYHSMGFTILQLI